MDLEQRTSQEGRVINTVNEPKLAITTEVKLTQQTTRKKLQTANEPKLVMVTEEQ